MKAARFSQLFEIAKGKKVEEILLAPKIGTKRYIQIGDLRNNDSLKFTFESGVEAVSEDICIAWDGANAGTVGYGLEGIIGSTIARLRPISEEIFSPFVGRYLQSKFQFLNTSTTGATIPHVSRDKLENLQIPLPPKSEQQRIAAILDKADALRTQRRQALAKLEGLAQAVFVEMFGEIEKNTKGFQTQKLGDVADFYSGNSLPEGEVYCGQKDGYLLLKVSDLNLEDNSREIVMALNWRSTKGSKAGTCPAGAVIFPKRGGAIGTNKKRILTRDAVLDPNLMGVLPRLDMIHPEFLFGWFNQFNLSDIASGSSVPQLNKQDLSPLRIALPCMDLQKSYAIQIQTILESKRLLFPSSQKIDALFSSLQHRAFRGEL